MTELKEIIESRIDKTKSGCWNWTGYVSIHGYGQFSYKRKSYKAHRLSYMCFVGEIPAGLELDHLCRNRKCVNPHHLDPVTRKENTLRGISFAAINARKKTCSRGHQYSHMYIYKGKPYARQCIECKRINNKAVRREKEITAEVWSREFKGTPRVTHCKRGHEYTKENTYVRPGGDRLCRMCRAESRIVYKAKKAKLREGE